MSNGFFRKSCGFRDMKQKIKINERTSIAYVSTISSHPYSGLAIKVHAYMHYKSNKNECS